MKTADQLKQFINDYETGIRTAAAELKEARLPELTEEGFTEFEQSGNRSVYEAKYFFRRKLLFVFGMKAILDGGQEDYRQLERVLLAVCEEISWALPAHVRRDIDDDWIHTVDLFAAETAQTLTELLDVLGSRLSEAVKKEVRRNVLARVLEPFVDSKPPYRVFEECSNNWNAVCNGALGCTALSIWQGEPVKLAVLLARLNKSLKMFMDGYQKDGACEEGLGYWTYGMGYYAVYADRFRQYSGGRYDLLSGEKCRRIMEFQQKCYFASGHSLSFSDGKSDSRFRVGLTSYFAMRHKTVTFPDFRLAAGIDDDHCYRWALGYRDWLWTRDYIDRLKTDTGDCIAEQPVYGCEVFRDTQWMICNGAGKTGAAIKGGHNDEPHNHNDVGSFYMVNRIGELLSDLGAGEYTKDYFREKRYDFLCNSSRGHNVPLINGTCQLAGKEHRADFSADGSGSALVSFGDAYQAGIIKAIIRRFDFDPATGILIVEDEFIPSAATFSITESLVTRQEVKIEGNLVWLGDAGILEVNEPDCEIEIKKELFTNHADKDEEISLIQWNVPLTHTSGKIPVKSRFTIVSRDT